MSLWRWEEWLPEIPVDARVDLGAGDTPLIRSARIGPAVGLKNLFFKMTRTNLEKQRTHLKRKPHLVVGQISKQS